MAEIKNIIFDLGGVILHIDYQLTEKAFEQLGCVNFNEKYSQARQLPLFDDFETGKISPEVFIRSLKQLLDLPVSDEAIRRAWNAMLLHLPEEKLELLKQLRKKYRLFLLSNTNEIHIEAFEGIIFRQHREKSLDGFFDKVYYSCRIDLRKPDTEVFELVLQQNALSAEETLFIDDSLQHVEGAGQAGIKAIHLAPAMQLKQLFKNGELIL